MLNLYSTNYIANDINYDNLHCNYFKIIFNGRRENKDVKQMRWTKFCQENIDVKNNKWEKLAMVLRIRKRFFYKFL